MQTTFIYSLKDPITNIVRYVGKSDNPNSRLSRHINQAKVSTKCHRLAWIKGLLDQNLKPILEILEEVSIEQWGERENYWISQFENLTNMIDGGKFCPMLNKDIVEKMKKTKKENPQVFSIETRKKLSDSIKKQWAEKTREYKKRDKNSYNKQSETMKNSWSSKTENEKKKVGNNISKGKFVEINQYDKNWNFIKTWNSIGDVEIHLFGRKRSILTKAIKSKELLENYYWDYKNKKQKKD